MTNYYAYRNWLVKINAPLFGTTKAYIFDLNSGAHHSFLVQASDTHSFICEFIDMNYRSNTDFSCGFPSLLPFSGQEASMVKGIFDRYF